MFTNVYGTNSITIPADMDITEDYRDSISPGGSTGSSFQPSSSMESTGFNNNHNYFSQSVPSYQYHHHHHSTTHIGGIQHSPTNGLFPQLGTTLPESQQAAYFAATPTESSPSPAGTNDLHAGAMSFEDLLTMYYVNGNNGAVVAAAAAAAAAAAVAATTSTTTTTTVSTVPGTSSMVVMNEAPSLSHLSTGFSLPQSQGKPFISFV